MGYKLIDGFWTKVEDKKSIAKEEAKKRGRRRKYGLRDEDIERMLIEQDNKCAICKKEFKPGEKPVIDHCHKINKVRGLTHSNCNAMIGFAKEDIETLRNAIEYIKFHYQPDPKGEWVNNPRIKYPSDRLIVITKESV